MILPFHTMILPLHTMILPFQTMILPFHTQVRTQTTQGHAKASALTMVSQTWLNLTHAHVQWDTCIP
jgi:hypothetical protein